MFLLETLKKNDNSTANDYYQLNVIGLDIIIFFFYQNLLGAIRSRTCSLQAAADAFLQHSTSTD